MPNDQKLKILEAFHESFCKGTTEPHMLLSLAESYLSLNCYDEAVEVLKRLVDRDTTNASSHFRLAEALTSAGRLADAAFEYAATASLDSENKFEGCSNALETLSQIEEANLHEARKAACTIHTNYPKNSAYTQELARLNSRCGDLSKARSLYEELLQRNDLSQEYQAEIQLMLAGVLEETGAFRQAADMLEFAIPHLGSEFDGNEIELNLAENYLRLGKFEDALTVYSDQANRSFLDKRRAKMLARMARCCEGLRKYDSAIECLIDVLSFVREDGLPEDDWQEKARILNEPNFFEHVYATLSRCYEAQGDFVRAKEAFKKEKEYYAKNLTKTESPKVQ